jgi:hypothetical protein
MNQLRPFDILVIQTAIEEYTRKYPGRPTPSAEEALAWRLCRRKRHQSGVTAEWRRLRLRIYERFLAWRKAYEEQDSAGEARHYGPDGILRYFVKSRKLRSLRAGQPSRSHVQP